MLNIILNCASSCSSNSMNSGCGTFHSTIDKKESSFKTNSSSTYVVNLEFELLMFISSSCLEFELILPRYLELVQLIH